MEWQEYGVAMLGGLSLGIGVFYAQSHHGLGALLILLGLVALVFSVMDVTEGEGLTGWL